ncbi:MAG TPA: hypothetical protein VFE51_08075 [Verrucomicrobiae bacterium]|nr:hypothetical protein [Verrucomicrobiae bacterium]
MTLPSKLFPALLCSLVTALAADSDPAHRSHDTERPAAWPDGLIPYDVSSLAETEQATVRQAMQRWMDTGARIAFVLFGQTLTLSLHGTFFSGTQLSWND